jgi:PAS domain S-box-containing protein
MLSSLLRRPLSAAFFVFTLSALAAATLVLRSGQPSSAALLGAWGDRGALGFEAALGLLFSLLLAYLTKVLLELRAHREGLEVLVRQRTNELRAREADLTHAQSMAQVGSWVLDLARRELRGSAEALRILGMSGSAPFSYQVFLSLVHADDRAAVDQASRASLKGAPYDIEYRIVAGDTIRWVRSIAELTFDAEGKLANAVGTIQDVSQSKRAEQALRASEARYRELFDTNPHPMWVYDLRTLNFLAVNDAAVAHYGYSRDEFLAMLVTEIRPPEEVPRLLQRIALVQKQNLRDGGIRRHRKKDGTLIDVEITSHTLEFDGRHAQMVLAHDVTERMLAERKLRDSEARFRSLTGMSSDFFWESDAEHRLTLLSTGSSEDAAQVLPFGSPLGKRRWEVPYLTPDESGWKAHRALLDAHRPFRDFELSRLGADGVERHIAVSGDPVFDAAGVFKGYRGVGSDITERKQREEALQRFRLAMDATADAVYLTDRATVRFIDVNAAACRMQNRTREELLALGPEWVLSTTRAELERAYDAVIAAGEATAPVEMLRKRPREDGSRVWVEIERRAQRTGDGWTIVTVVRDITERKRQEFVLRRLNEELEQRVAGRTHALEVANKELEAFSYSVSHDLRAPLRAIHGFSRLLEAQHASALDDEGRDMLRRVNAGAEKMGLLIDDLLRLSRISRQSMRVGPVDLSALAHEAAEELQAGEPERRVEWVIAPQVSATGDPGLLGLVLQNLIGNAWKYSARRNAARIEFGVDENDGRRTFFVRDNGVGFDMAHAAKLFGAFQRLHSAAEFPGSGIGLATVARILYRHGGSAWAEARVGEGASFYFSLG